MTEAPSTLPRATHRKTSAVTVHEVAALAGVSPALTYSVFGDIIHGLESVRSDAGIQLFIGATRHDEKREEKVLRAFLSRRQNGIVLVGSVNTDAGHSLLRHARVPVVEAWDWTSDSVDSLVVFSNAAHVVDLGYHRPAFVGWLGGLDSHARAGRDGFVSAMSKLSPGRIAPVVDSVERVISIEAGRKLLDATLREHPDTDVLVRASDVFATGALLEAQSRGLKIPEDIAVTGFGDFQLNRHLSPALTAVRTPNGTIGRRAAELLLERRALPGLAPRIPGPRFHADRARQRLNGTPLHNQHLSSTTERI